MSRFFNGFLSVYGCYFKLPGVDAVWNEIFATACVPDPSVFGVGGVEEKISPTVEDAEFIGVNERVSADRMLIVKFPEAFEFIPLI